MEVRRQKNCESPRISALEGHCDVPPWPAIAIRFCVIRCLLQNPNNALGHPCSFTFTGKLKNVFLNIGSLNYKVILFSIT